MFNWCNKQRLTNYIKTIDISNTKLFNELDSTNVIKIHVSPLHVKFTRHAYTHNCLLIYNNDNCVMINLISYDIIAFFHHLLNDNDKQINERYKLSDNDKHNNILAEVSCEDIMRMFTRINRINE